MKSVVRVFALVSLISINAQSEKTTMIVNCEDLKNNHREYGCSHVQKSEIKNNNFQCLDALKDFSFLQNEISDARRRSARRHKPSIIPGKKAVVSGMANQHLSISDSEKDYKVSKDKMKQRIARSLVGGFRGKKFVKMVIKTPKGEAKVKVNISASENGSGFNVDSWEKDNSPEQADDILMALGQSDINTDLGDDSQADAMTAEINNAESTIEKQKSDIEEAFAKKIQEVNENNGLNALEKIGMRRDLRRKKRRRLSQLQRLLTKVPHYRGRIKEECAGHGKIVKTGSINGSSSSESRDNAQRSSVASR